MKKLFLFLPLFLLNACQNNAHSLNGTAYQFQLNETPILIAFDKNENRYYGKVVNNYFGNFTQTGNKITFQETGSTMMMGPEKAMKAEQEWFKTISQISSYSQSKNALIFTLKDGSQIKLNKTTFPN
ncbi:MAG: META domain-containing protein [Alphaproteobacteria bacterium]|nr:META domain-containing protein [Alphaproteobacteria bacterium]